MAHVAFVCPGGERVACLRSAAEKEMDVIVDEVDEYPVPHAAEDMRLVAWYAEAHEHDPSPAPVGAVSLLSTNTCELVDGALVIEQRADVLRDQPFRHPVDFAVFRDLDVPRVLRLIRAADFVGARTLTGNCAVALASQVNGRTVPQLAAAFGCGVVQSEPAREWLNSHGLLDYAPYTRE